MDTILATTKLYSNNQTAVPSIIRDKFDVNGDTIIEWGINEKNEPIIKFRKKRNIEDLIGMVQLDEITDSVKLKKELYE